MLLDEKNHGGGRPEPWCLACRQPVKPGQKTAKVHFATDPQGMKGLSGTYHAECSKPFASMANVINLRPWTGR